MGTESESMMTTEYIELSSHARLAITQDPVPLNPRMMGECITGTYTPPSYWGRATEGPLPLFTHPGDLIGADDRLWEPDSWEPERKIQRWSWANYGVLLERHGATYWFCDANAFEELHGEEFSRENQHDAITADRTFYRQYEDGEARIVTFQRKATFKRVTRRFHDKQDDLLHVWEDVDQMADVYLDNNFTPAQVAYEFFYGEMNRKERTIIQAMFDSERAL